jgi:hypothetical protein
VSRRVSTASHCDAAFQRIVKLSRKHNLPQWATLAEADVGLRSKAPGEGNQSFREKLTGRELDQLRNDLHVYNAALGPLPWHHAARVKEQKAPAKKAAPPRLAPPEPEEPK